MYTDYPRNVALPYNEKNWQILYENEHFADLLSIPGIEGAYHCGFYGSGACRFTNYDWAKCEYPQRLVVDMRWFDTGDDRCYCQ